MNLSSEMLQLILKKLENVEDVVNLGSSCLRFTELLSNLSIWRIILAKTELVEHDRVMTNRVQTLTTFLSSIPDSEAIFSLLHQTIYERYPATDESRERGPVVPLRNIITVSFPGDPQHHSVSLLGLKVLVLTDRQAAGHTVHKLHLGMVRCATDGQGLDLCSLLARCPTWKITLLNLRGHVGWLTWSKLEMATAKGGKLDRLIADIEVVKRGDMNDVKTVWESTITSWWMGRHRINTIELYEGLWEDGWRKIEKIL